MGVDRRVVSGSGWGVVSQWLRVVSGSIVTLYIIYGGSG